MKTKKSFRPSVFKILGTKDKLTAAAGLGTVIEVFDSMEMSRRFSECLPERSSNRSFGSYRLGLIQLSSFIYGHDCLDDLEEFKKDPSLKAVMKGEIVAPRTMGDFLRDFDNENIEKLRDFLSWMGQDLNDRMRATLPVEFAPMDTRVDIDSTFHDQESNLMEGLAWNYENRWGLESQVVFDRLGICRDVKLRAGNSKSGTEVPNQLENVFKYANKDEKKFLSADSAYCHQEVIHYCLREKIKFTFTLNEAYVGNSKENLMREVTHWEKWKYTEEDVKKAEKRGKTLPEVELGRVYWRPGWAENIQLPVIIKRTKVQKESKDGQFNLLADQWEPYAVVTNFNLFNEFSYQGVMEHHTKRGNVENFIREEKYGYDLKHFPCQKFAANNAFLLLAMVAHNLMRWMAHSMNPDKPHYSKKLRRRFIFIPGKVVRHARQLILRIPDDWRLEVLQLKQQLTALQRQPLLDTC